MKFPYPSQMSNTCSVAQGSGSRPQGGPPSGQQSANLWSGNQHAPPNIPIQTPPVYGNNVSSTPAMHPQEPNVYQTGVPTSAPSLGYPSYETQNQSLYLPPVVATQLGSSHPMAGDASTTRPVTSSAEGGATHPSESVPPGRNVMRDFPMPSMHNENVGANGGGFGPASRELTLSGSSDGPGSRQSVSGSQQRQHLPLNNYGWNVGLPYGAQPGPAENYGYPGGTLPYPQHAVSRPGIIYPTAGVQ